MLDVAKTRAELAAFVPFSPLEAFHQANILRLIDTAGAACFRRDYFNPGQLTASAWVVAADTQRVLLVHHAKSGNWFQPGGHIEDSDETLLGAAIREVEEECGFTPTFVQPPRLFDVDMHGINAHKGEPDHVHFDCRYLFFISSESALTLSEESNAVKWVTLEEAKGLVRYDPSNNRYFEKTPALFKA